MDFYQLTDEDCITVDFNNAKLVNQTGNEMSFDLTKTDQHHLDHFHNAAEWFWNWFKRGLRSIHGHDSTFFIQNSQLQKVKVCLPRNSTKPTYSSFLNLSVRIVGMVGRRSEGNAFIFKCLLHYVAAWPDPSRRAVRLLGQKQITLVSYLKNYFLSNMHPYLQCI